MKKRRKFTADFKSKVALEALREQQPIHEIAKRYQVHASQVTEWKKALQGNASSVFEGTSAKHDATLKWKLKDDRLYKQIGQLSIGGCAVVSGVCDGARPGSQTASARRRFTAKGDAIQDRKRTACGIKRAVKIALNFGFQGRSYHWLIPVC